MWRDREVRSFFISSHSEFVTSANQYCKDSPTFKLLELLFVIRLQSTKNYFCEKCLRKGFDDTFCTT